jgi:predicted alpha/beta superfamily hydrolase
MEIIKRKTYIELLEREASIYIVLPDDYHISASHYPVVYFHDGQNLIFKEDSSMGETWDIIGAFSDPTFPKVIAIGVSCAKVGNKRLQEYNIFQSTFPSHPAWHVPGIGRIYLKYLMEILKPSIDEEFRTKKDKQDTYMLGSSMGGVISLEAAYLYSDFIGHVAGLSNAFYASIPELESLINQDSLKLSHLYLDTGDQELGLEKQQIYIEANKKIASLIQKTNPQLNFKFELIEGGQHNEVAWRLRLPTILKFLFDV